MAEDGADAWFKHGRRRKGVRWQGSLALFHFLRHFIKISSNRRWHQVFGFGTLSTVVHSVFHNGGGDMSCGSEGELDYVDAFAVLINT